MNINAGVRGRYRLVVLDKDGLERLDTGYFENLITDGGINNWFTQGAGGANNQFRQLSVGTGSTIPAYTDTVLVNRLATVETTHIGNFLTYPWAYSIYSATFNPGTVVGNVSELGTGLNSNGTALFSRSLIKDALGNSTTVTVLAEETLVVYWQLWLNTGAPDVTTVVNGYTITARPAAVTTPLSYGITGDGWNPNAVLGAINLNAVRLDSTALPSKELGRSGTNCSTITYAAYVANSFTRTAAVTWAVGNGSMAANYIGFNFGIGSYHFGVSPSIPKLSANSLKITFSVSVSRQSPPAQPMPVNPLTLSPIFVYDRQDLSSLYQDSAGSIPVTQVGDPVGRITDLSGNGRHLIQATESKRPLLGQDAWGKYYVQGDGIDDSYGTALPVTGAADKYFMCAAAIEKCAATYTEMLMEMGVDSTVTGGIGLVGHLSLPYGLMYAHVLIPYDSITVGCSFNMSPTYRGIINYVLNYTHARINIRSNLEDVCIGENVHSVGGTTIRANQHLYVLARNNTSQFSTSRLYYMWGSPNILNYDQLVGSELWIQDRTGVKS